MKFNGKYTKAITFSFDDGNIDDIRLIEIFKKYGLKATFNLNSGGLSETSTWIFNGIKEVKHINFTDYPHIYDGFEIAAHTYRHPHLENCNDNTVYNEIKLDMQILEFLYGYKIKGMALPFGTYNNRTAEIVEDCGLKYCRSVKSTNNFELPNNVILHPTCHFKAANIFDLAEEFLNSNYDEAKIFYIWGHSYELVTEEEWAEFENFCKKISGKEDIFYCTNIEALDSLK